MSSAAMAAVFPHAPPLHDLEQSSSYAPLPDQPEPFSSQRRPIKTLILSVLFLFVLVALILNQSPEPRDSANVRRQDPSVLPENLEPASRGVEQGVSEKAFRDFAGERDIYPWTNAMLSWQRTSYHFQPEKKWMNDPNGPLFHMGWYHLFYQYNPDSAMWDKITWGHAVSRDLIHWLYLPLSMVPDKWYDINGVWTGSATILPDGRIVMLYTGDTEDLVQVQNLAYPANLSDPLLLDWEKYPGNPILVPPLGIGSTDFRDPTTGLIGPDGKWRVLIGSKINKTGISLVYKTENFTSYDLVEEVLHEVPGTGMWECIDFYPVLLSGSNGLDTSTNGPDTKHVLKASLDDNRHDYYAIGSYDPIKEKWTPDNPKLDVGIGLRVDYGKYYASKTFYDHNKKRRVLWGWIGETDSESADLLKGWSSVQTIPRTVVFDVKTRANILQWPVSEVESLRSGKTEFNSVEVAPGSIIPLHLSWASQLDVEATFEVDEEDLAAAVEADVGYDCVTSGGSQKRGSLGPFGLLVLADEKLSEMTPVYFYITRGANGSDQTYFCSDETRSSTAPDVGKLVYGSSVPVLEGEKLSMRLLVDHSIVESFAQGGRRVITLRVYPTRAIYGSARLFLFNNATAVKVKASVKAWQVDSADIHPFPLDYPSF